MKNGSLDGGNSLVYLVMCVVAGAIASVGLITDRVEIVIGSMLVSPLLIPLAKVWDDRINSHWLRIWNVGLFMLGTILIVGCSFLFTLVYDYSVGLDALPVSSELYARAPAESNIFMLLFANIVISVLSGFLYIFVERLDKGNGLGHVIGIAISTALAPPASAIGVLASAYFIQYGYYEKYDIGQPLLIISLNVHGILLGAAIAYVLTRTFLKNQKREDGTPHSIFSHSGIGNMCW